MLCATSRPFCTWSFTLRLRLALIGLRLLRPSHSSKAVGDPPFFLASAVFFAIKDAIVAARTEAGHKETWFPLDNPATPERIRMACLDEFTAPFVCML
ncbi:Xanthine dehydrogenase [Melia azedarach]|uniref:Xanthine dehydrogenase n=1 Tax=Melia azedarach TaxID=155640 RepID=A0ACC1YP46_MELAZ|nr:Xanthine dehydrogenase [Melia azedarach]